MTGVSKTTSKSKKKRGAPAETWCGKNDPAGYLGLSKEFGKLRAPKPKKTKA